MHRRPTASLARAAVPFALGVALLAGCASAPLPPQSAAMTPARSADGVMVNARSLTLYTFDQDIAGSGKSTCNGDCAVKWPPLFAAVGASATGDFSIVTRDDDRRQWAYKGKPLYTWPDDQAPGDQFGDNYLKAWRVARN